MEIDFTILGYGKTTERQSLAIAHRFHEEIQHGFFCESSGFKSERTARTGQDLADAGLISPDHIAEIDETQQQFSMAVTPAIMDLIHPNNANDPIARQFIPSSDGLTVLPEERADPIGDDPFTPVKGITHRYPDRVLLKPTHVCPVYCRFCFRREKVGNDGQGLSPTELETALDYIRDHNEVWEVILTGGDPMILSPERIAAIIQALDAIAHVDVIRIHTRVPVVDPERITPDVVQALKVDTPVYVVLHTNHPREFSEESRTAIARLVDAGIPMLSQSVLLKGVNDDPETMTQLMRTLIRNRIKPYYLHHGDMAKGTNHFRTTISDCCSSILTFVTAYWSRFAIALYASRILTLRHRI